MRLLIICLALLAIPSVSFGQAAIPPQLKNLLDFYFRGAGSSNSVDRIQIKDGAINLAKLDTGPGGIFEEIASLNYVDFTFVTKPTFESFTGSVSTTYYPNSNPSNFVNPDGARTAVSSVGYLLASTASSTYATKSELTTLSNHVDTTYVKSNFFNSYFSGTVDVVNVDSTNRFVFEKGLLKTHTLNP